MAASAEKIEQQVLGDLIAQRESRKVPEDDVAADLLEQKRLRAGDYSEYTVPGAAQMVWGAVENFGTMISGFASAVPGTAAGVGASLGAGDISVFPEAFYEQADKTTYAPKSLKGQRYGKVLADTYSEWIDEKWGGYVGGLVDQGYISPEEATYYRVSADALLLGLGLRAGAYAYGLGKTVGKASKPSYNRVNINPGPAPMEGQFMPGSRPGQGGGRTGGVFEGELVKPALRIGEQKKLPAPQKQLPAAQKKLAAPRDMPVAVAARIALDKGVPVGAIDSAIKGTKNPAEAVNEIHRVQVETAEAQAERSELLRGAAEELLDNGGRPHAQGWGGGTILRAERGNEFLGRIGTMSDNPQWAQELMALHGYGVKQARNALTKGANNERLGPVQKRFVDDYLRMATEEGESKPLVGYGGQAAYLDNLRRTDPEGYEERLAMMDESIAAEDKLAYYERLAIIEENTTPPDLGDPSIIFKNRQAGAIDPKVFAEVARMVARPGVMTAKTAADLSHALARQVGFKMVTDIRKINSPTAKMLADRIMPTETSTIPLGAGYHERIALKEGLFNSRIENIFAPLRKHVVNKNATKTLRLVALPKRVNDEIFRGMDTGIVREDLAPAVKALRAVFNEVYDYQKAAGVDIGYLENQIPHVWNHNKIAREEWGRKKGGKFTRFLMEVEGKSFDVSQEIIATITKEEGFLDFLEDAGGRLHAGMDYSDWASRAHKVGGGPSKPGHTKHRVLDGKSDRAKEWLVTDVESLLTSYVNRAVQHAEYTRIAGKGESELNRLVRQIIEEQELHAREGGKLRAASPHTTAQEIYDVFDALQNKFHIIKNPTVRKTSKAIAGYEVLQKLTLVALAQFPESLMPAARYRVATTTKALPGIPIPLKSYAVGIVDSLHNAMSNLSVVATGKRVIPKSEIREHLERIGVIYTSSLASSATRMAGPVGVITNRAIRAFGMEAITNLQRTVALDTIQSMIRQNARALAKGLAQGTKDRMYRQELIELGIKPQEAIDWYNDGMPKGHPISTKFDVAHVRGIDTTIIMPKAANAPRVYNDPRFQLITLFTRFFTVFGNTVLKTLIKKMGSKDVTNIRKLGTVGSLAAAVGVAYYTQFLREAITGYKYREEDDPMRVVDAFDRSGLTAMFTRLYPLFSAYKYGAGAKMVGGILGGPFGSDVGGFIEAAQGSNEQRARFLAKQTPIMTVTPASEDMMYEFYLELIDGLPE